MKGKKRIKIKSLLICLNIIFCVFAIFPVQPVAAGPALQSWTSNGFADIIEDGDVKYTVGVGHVKENGPAIDYFATYCLPLNCGAEVIRRYYVEWNITDLWNATGIMFNMTIAYAEFQYEGIKHDVNTYGIIHSTMNQTHRVRPSNPSSNDDLYRMLGAGRDYQLSYDDTFPVVGINQEIDMLNNVAQDFNIIRRDAIAVDDPLSWFAIGVVIENDTSGVSREVGFGGSDTPPPSIPVPTLKVYYWPGVYCFPSNAEIENPLPGAYLSTDNDLLVVEYEWYRIRVTYENWNITSERPPLYIAFSPDFNQTWINVTMSVGYELDIDNMPVSYANMSVLQNISYITVPIRIGNETDLEGAAPDEEYYNILYNSYSWQLNVTFWIWLEDTIPDQENIPLFADCGLENWDFMLYFDVYNLGGYSEDCGTGNYEYPVGGDVFEMCAWFSGIACKRQYYRKIQSMTMQFAVRFLDNDTTVWIGEDQYMQNGTHQGGGEKASDPGDWALVIRVAAYDPADTTWVSVMIATTLMEEGDEGADDEWIKLRNNYIGENANYALNQDFFALIEEEEVARFRMWFDWWIARANGSSVTGARSSAYYYGMQRHTNGWLLWESLGNDVWVPMKKNVSETWGFGTMTTYNNLTMYAQNMDLMYIEISLERISNRAGESNFKTCVQDFNEKNIATMGRNTPLFGIDTRTFEDTKIADQPSTGPLRQLVESFMRLPSMIWDTFADIQAILWAQIGGYFPWFTDFIDDLYSLILSFSQFLTSIASGLAALLNFMADSLWIFPVITGVIGDTWAMLTSWLDPFVANAGEWVLLAVIVFGIIPFAANLTEGRMSAVRSDLEIVWGFLSTILDWTFRLGKMAIDFVLGLIPG